MGFLDEVNNIDAKDESKQIILSISELSELSDFDYEKIRNEQAKLHKVRSTALDKEVSANRISIEVLQCYKRC